MEKAREIKVKADEEFAIEKVHQRHPLYDDSLNWTWLGQTREARTTIHRCTA